MFYNTNDEVVCDSSFYNELLLVSDGSTASNSSNVIEPMTGFVTADDFFGWTEPIVELSALVSLTATNLDSDSEGIVVNIRKRQSSTTNAKEALKTTSA